MNRLIRFRLLITSPLPAGLGYIPFAPTIDFEAVAQQVGAGGVLDPNSIEVTNMATGEKVEYARSEDLTYGDSGRIEWPIKHPDHTRYEISFCTVSRRPALRPQVYAPLVGTGDLLRYNAGEPRPISMPYDARLVDLSGDGRADLVGCWNYYRRPGDPISGLALYPRTAGDFLFGDMARLRRLDSDGTLGHFSGTYTAVDFVDWAGDGCIGIVFAEQRSGRVGFYRQCGCDGGGVPPFEEAFDVEVPVDYISQVLVADLDGDGVLDLVVNGHFLRNTAGPGDGFSLDQPLDLGAGERLAFIDLDGDGVLEMVSLEGPRLGGGIFWRRRQSVTPLQYGPALPLDGIDTGDACSQISAAVTGASPGLLIQRAAYQEHVFYAWQGWEAGTPRFGPPCRLQSLAAVVTWSDQAWPCVADWNGDGTWDLVIGGGYGWPRLVQNRGSAGRHALDEPQRIPTLEGGDIRVLRTDILPVPHWHDMGYPYPVWVDWDGDGLPDLLLPNETNRIVWYRNIGSRTQPEFGPRRYLEVDGFADSPAKRQATAALGADPDQPNHPYPHDPASPFYWRTGAAFADWNGDGLVDLITHDDRRQAALFVQYRAADGEMRLRRQGPVLLEDGRLLDDTVVGRDKHWTESFRAVDWDGDGLIDLVWNLAGSGEIYLLRNVGSPTEPVFALPRQFKCYGKPLSFTIHGPNAWPADLNGDGKPDLLGCVEWSVYPFFAHAALEMAAPPSYRIESAQCLRENPD
jgi:hypothetical protein